MTTDLRTTSPFIDAIAAGAIVVAILGSVGWHSWRASPKTPANAISLDYPTLLKDENFHLLLGNAYAAAGNLDQAIVEEHEALKINPSNASALNNVGFYSLQAGRYATAIDALEQSVRLNPSEDRPRNNLQLAYTKAIAAAKTEEERAALRARQNASRQASANTAASPASSHGQ